MINCELFERDFKAWQDKELAGEAMRGMDDHSRTCAHCATFTADAANLRRRLAKLRPYQPYNEFEHDLGVALRSLRRRGSGASMRRAGWTVVGAGLATGLAIGLLMILPEPAVSPTRLATVPPVTNSTVVPALPVTQPADAASVNVPSVAEARRDSGNSRSDSLPRDVTPAYDVNRHSQVVSGSGR